MKPSDRVDSVLGATNIHLDFHTPGFQRSVGEEWNARQFAEQLEEANVESVTIFAKGCHGFTYYDSAIGPRHPHLEFDMLADALEACHEKGIGVLAYYTVAWDNYLGAENPDWYQRDGDGKPLAAETRDDRWEYLCLNSPYTEEVIHPHVREILDYDIDGFWFDILLYHPDACTCRYCSESMQTRGLDPGDPEHRRQHRARVCRNFAKRTTRLVKNHDSDLLVTYNHRLGLGLTQDLYDTMDYLVIESLPVGWGYIHTPMYARYSRNFDRPVQGMTGVFHKVWGDFGTVKHTNQLKYELSSSLIHHLPVSVGDQLRPRGKLEPSKYDVIEEAFAYASERSLPSAEPLRDVAVIFPGHHDPAGRQASMDPDNPEMSSHGAVGATKFLLETHQQFDVLDQRFARDRLTEFRTAILPDTGPLDGSTTEAIRAFVDRGGTVVASGTASLTEDGFALGDVFGVVSEGRLPYSTAYLELDQYTEGLPEMECVSYGPFQSISLGGAESRAIVVGPTTERSETRRYSHYHAPPERKLDVPAITYNEYGDGAAVYLGSNLFTQYFSEDYHAHRTLLSNVLSDLRSIRVLDADAPPSVEVNAMRVDEDIFVHATNFHASRAGESLPQITESNPASEVEVTVSGVDVSGGSAVTPGPIRVSVDDRTARVTFDTLELHEIAKFR